MSTSPKEVYILCCECGVIMPESEWTYWQRTEEGDDWRPSAEGEGDPMMRCPYCGCEHVDSDSDLGIFEGMILDVTRYREEIRPEYADSWRFVRSRL